MTTPPRRRVDLASISKLSLTNASLHNLRNFGVEIPLGRFVCITGVSGSGKSTLVGEIIHPLLVKALGTAKLIAEAEAEETDEIRPVGVLRGAEQLAQVIMV